MSTRPRPPRLRGIAALALVALTAATSIFAITPSPARAAGQDALMFAPHEEPTAIFGANAIVRIDGRITFNDQCPEGSVSDWMYAATDVYVVAAGSAGAGQLSDVGGGRPNTIVAGATVFTDEVIGVTAPTGDFDEGTYDVVYDTCQDGTYDPGTDTVFPGAITVTLPDILPLANDAIYEMKGEALLEYAAWMASRFAMEQLFKLADKAIKVQCEVGNAIGCAMKKLDYFDGIKKNFLALTLSEANHYLAIALDPPDANFDRVTTVGAVEAAGGRTDSPASDATTDTLRPMATENAVSEALLHAVERYQGAVAAGDGAWALEHAREAANLAGILAQAGDATSGALGDLRAALAADPDIAQAIGTASTFSNRVWTSGFTAAERRTLLNEGIGRTGVAALEAELRSAANAGLSMNGLLGQLDDTIAKHGSTADAAAAAAADWASVVASIETDDSITAAGPGADAGGSYVTAEGETITLHGSTGAAYDAAAWDLDADGQFDDASGLTPDAAFAAAGPHLVGLRVTANGTASVAYALVRVADTAHAPVLSAATPANRAATVTVGGSAAFAIAASDPDGGSPSLTWAVDGAPAGTGSTFSYAPTLADVGSHTVTVTADDGTAVGGATRHAWDVVVLAPDVDADGWTATTDCDDARAAVHPTANELFGNDVDDDCDPGTPDGPPGGLTGSMWSWGSNHNGSIGDGTVYPVQPTPVTIPNLDTVVQVESSHRGGFAVLDSGEVRGWGINGVGELGIGYVGGISAVPVSPRVVGGGAGNLTGVTQISTDGGNVHVVARRADGSVVSWGDNGQRQVGDGSTVNYRPYPVQVLASADGTSLTGVRAVEAGYAESYALMDDGTVLAWGQIRCDGGTSIRIEPHPVELDLLGGNVRQMASGNQWAMFLKEDGSVWTCGGVAPYAGRPTPSMESVFTPGQVTGFGPGSGAIDIAGGVEGGLILKADGTVWAWGYNANGSLSVIGVAGGASAHAPVQVPLPAGPPVVDIDMDNACHALALRADGSLLSWGCDSFGQVGDGPDITPQETPTVIAIPGQAVYAVSNSSWNSLVLTRPLDDPAWERPATWVRASVADVTIGEGSAGSFTASLAAALPEDVTLDWSIVAGSATAADVELASGTVTIPAGSTTAEVPVSVLDDALDEDDESFTIELTGASNGIGFARPQANGTIADNDAAPAVSVAPATIAEGSTPLTDAAVTVTLSHPSATPVSVDLTTADGSATSPADFAPASGTVVFAPGQTSTLVHLAVNGDTVPEPDESFSISLADPVGAVLGSATALLTITDDDPLVLAVTSPVVTEGETGTTEAVFTVDLVPDPPAGSAVTVDYAVVGRSADVPGDVAAASGTLTFEPGDGPKTVSVAVTGDTEVEGDEVFRLALGTPSASDGRAILPGDNPDAVIVNDDAEATPTPDPSPDPTPTPDPSPVPTPTPDPSPVPPAGNAPTVDAGPAASGAEGATIALDATVADEDAGDTLSLAWTYDTSGLDTGATCAFADPAGVDTSITCTDDGVVTATLTATDASGLTGTDSVEVTVANADPAVDITAPANLSTVGAGVSVKLAASLTDPGSGDSEACSVDWGDGTTGDGTVASGRCTASHAFAGPSVPTIRVTVTDDDGGAGQAEVVLVVTTPATKVNGGGWIAVDGHRTSFGFVVAPEGDGFEGEIQVIAAGHRFHGHEVAGLVAERPTATWSGTGRWDGDDGFTYVVSVSDTRNGGDRKGSPDTISIEIRDAGGAIVFAAAGALGGGNVKVG